MRQVILDTETTGMPVEQGHRIIEIGCVELINRKLTGKTYHQYINPQRDVDPGALAVHGITDDFLKDKPTFREIVQPFMAFVEGAELIIHNAPFDVGFINAELTFLKKNWQAITHYCRIIDTLPLARQLHVGQRNSLDALCKRYGIDNSQRELHGALLDAHLLARVYLAMTGGQATFFGATETEEKSTQEQTQTEVTANMPVRHLTVQMATADELALHDAQLQTILKKGKCLWLS
jgi:DNA polymerase-3 subunit epsilon